MDFPTSCWLKSSFKSDKRRHNFPDTMDDLCICTDAETTQHFLLKCPFYDVHRIVLFQTLNPTLLANDMNHLNEVEMTRLTPLWP